MMGRMLPLLQVGWHPFVYIIIFLQCIYLKNFCCPIGSDNVCESDLRVGEEHSPATRLPTQPSRVCSALIHEHTCTYNVMYTNTLYIYYMYIAIYM